MFQTLRPVCQRFIKCTKYWLRLLKMPSHRFAHNSYRMLRYLHEQNRKTLTSSVCFVMYKDGFNLVLENQGVGDKMFLKALKNRLITTYKQEWSDSTANNERYIMYSKFKSSLSMPPVLHDIKHIKARNCLLRGRLGVSQLRSHQLRFEKKKKKKSPKQTLYAHFVATRVSPGFTLYYSAPRTMN